jgi:hypothetical protein
MVSEAGSNELFGHRIRIVLICYQGAIDRTMSMYVSGHMGDLVLPTSYQPFMEEPCCRVGVSIFGSILNLCWLVLGTWNCVLSVVGCQAQ